MRSAQLRRAADGGGHTKRCYHLIRTNRMSSAVKLPGKVTPRFPPHCVCCLDPAVVRHQASWSLYDLAPVATQGITLKSSTFTLSGIPYCREHAAAHDEWVEWGKESKVVQMVGLPTSRLTIAKYLFSPFAALGILGAVAALILDRDPLLGVFLGMVAGLFVGLILVFEDQRRRQSEAIGPKPATPRGNGGSKIVHFTPAMGLKLGVKVDVMHMLNRNVSVSVEELILDFDNPEYARLFAGENGVTA